MVWYYREGDQENGPVSKAELQALITSKQVSAQTPVKSAGMNEWYPLIDVVKGKVVPPKPATSDETPAPGPVSTSAVLDADMDGLTPKEEVEPPGAEGTQNQEVTTPPVDDSPPKVACTHCGGFFPRDQVISFDTQFICAACKPMFVQKLKEGAIMPGAVRYGGFWIRFLALFIDKVILYVAGWIIMVVLSIINAVVISSITQGGEEFAAIGMMLVVLLEMFLSLALVAFYSTFFHGRWGATLGKMACGLRVVTPEGDPITYMRAFGRFWGAILSGWFTLFIGCIIAAFDDEKRALHDHICSTRVIRKY